MLRLVLLLLASTFHWFVNSELEGCPDQCSCTLERSYHSITGPYDQVDILCNRYAARFGADLSILPNITNLRSGGRNIKLSIEQMNFEQMPANIFAQQRMIALRLLHNPKLKSIDGEIFRRNKKSLQLFVMLDHDQLETFPFRALSHNRALTELSIELKKPLLNPVEQDLKLRNLINLESLSLFGEQFLPVLPEISMLKKLKQLTLNGVKLANENFPKNLFSSLTNLVSLNLASNNLRYVPSEISEAQNLRVLSLENNFLIFDAHQQFFDSVPRNIHILNLRSNSIRAIPCEMFKLANLRYLKLDSKIICLKCQEDEVLVRSLNESCSSDQTGLVTHLARAEKVKPSFDKTTLAAPKSAPIFLQYHEYADIITYEAVPEGSGESPEPQEPKIEPPKSRTPMSAFREQSIELIQTTPETAQRTSIRLIPHDIKDTMKDRADHTLRKRPVLLGKSDESGWPFKTGDSDNNDIETEFYYYEYIDTLGSAGTIADQGEDEGSGDTEYFN